MPGANSRKYKTERSNEIWSKLLEADCSDSCFDLATLPSAAFSTGTDHAGSGICWCPQSMPAGISTHLASSRLGKDLESFPGWFDALRTFGCSVDRDTMFLLTAEGVTADRFIKRLGKLFDVPVVCVKRFPKRITSAWIERQLDTNSKDEQTLWVETETRHSMDDLLISIAKEVRVLRVRSKGNVHQSLTKRLETSGRKTWVLVDDSLTKTTLSNSLINAGAAGWWLYDSENDSNDAAPFESSAVDVKTDGVSRVPADSSDYAIHWTRRRQGAWPDQSDQAYHDDLIFRRDSRDHHAFSSLRRILMTERLVASNDLTRGTVPVVAFADVRLTEIRSRRVFRSHLGRWDFEPYGIAVRKDCLNQLGARPVIYGNDNDWSRLSLNERPFFQLATSSDGKHDWRSEREIRLCGDLLLKRVGRDEALVFVPTAEEANSIAALSRWPVVVLDE